MQTKAPSHFSFPSRNKKPFFSSLPTYQPTRQLPFFVARGSQKKTYGSFFSSSLKMNKAKAPPLSSFSAYLSHFCQLLKGQTSFLFMPSKPKNSQPSYHSFGWLLIALFEEPLWLPADESIMGSMDELGMVQARIVSTVADGGGLVYSVGMEKCSLVFTWACRRRGWWSAHVVDDVHG